MLHLVCKEKKALHFSVYLGMFKCTRANILLSKKLLVELGPVWKQPSFKRPILSLS
jgi:hypothetical protein